MNILVTHASKMGGTQGLAEAVAEGLGEGAVVLPVDAVKRLDGYDAVVIGGGLYAGRWTRAGRRFVRRHAKELREKDVWFFSSGPLDDSAHEHPIDPTRSVRRMMEKVGAKGHVTFGGRLPADAKGFPASAMAKKHAGDWRNHDEARAWGQEVAAEMSTKA
ncbi:MAG: flavodoxin domain-containing protein [Acidimicrobiales bacterium]